MINTDTIKDQIKLFYNQGGELRKRALELENQFRLQYQAGTSPLNIGSIQCDMALESFITQDPDMIKLKEDVRKLVSVDDPVLICGETGTGKGIIAKALHGYRRGKFIHVNCTSLPDELIESELFGHKKGSFTGAVADRIGKFQEATGGTIFLDEIGDMPLNMQTKLLLAIEEKWICPVGSNEEIPIDCRIISATNQFVKERIRGDLYWRLSTFILQIKPLRERGDDWKLIAKSLDPKWTIRNDPAVTYWEGNVRTLQQAIRRWKVLESL